MMDNMECRYLTILFPHEEKEGVEKFREFREVIPPTSVCHLKIKTKLEVNALMAVRNQLTLMAMGLVE